MKRLILMCGLLASGFSFGADWVLIGETNSNIKHYYDVDSVKPLGKHQFEFWEKHVEKNENKVMRAKVDCVNDSYTVMDYYKYRGDNVVDSITNQEYKIIPPPDTAGYITIERVCNYGLSLEIGKLNLPKKSDFSDDAEFQVARFFALGFQDYTPTMDMMNDYFDLMEAASSEKQIYKMFIKTLDGVEYLKFKYLNLKNKAP